MMNKTSNSRIARACGLMLLVACSLLVASLFSCSTTSKLPEDEYLYTGIKSISVSDKLNTLAEQTALEEANAALAYAPNNSLFGSSTIRLPFPVGLWIYNSMEDKEYKGIKKWWYNTFATTPRTISSASPDTRVMVARNVLQNYGYFRAKVDYDTITGKNPRTQKIAYDIKLGRPYMLDSIMYAFSETEDSIIRATQSKSYISKGKQFSVVDLQNEKTRLNTEFHNNGFYYYRPDYIQYFADSTYRPGQVQLLISEDKDLPAKARRQWNIGRMSVFVRKGDTQGTRTMAYDDTVNYKRLTYGYQGKHIPLAPRVMFRGFKFWTGRQYNEANVNSSLEHLSNTGIFSNLQFTFTPHDTTDTCSVLDVRLDATLDKPINAEVEFNLSQKSNNQIGPDASIKVSKKNAFHYGETFAVKLNGAYFWQYKDRNSEVNNMDSYRFGIEGSLSFPWLIFPKGASLFRRYPTSTKFSLAFSRENVAKLYRFNKFSLGIEYSFQTTPYITHTFSPLTVELVDTRHVDYDKLSDEASVITANMLEPSFVPAMQYKFVFNNSTRKDLSVLTNVELNVKESGNLISCIQGICGKNMGEKGKGFIFKDYSQFIKIYAELKNKFLLTKKSCVATRLLLGTLFSYGNSERWDYPYSEAFYSGGPNSVRAFSTRSIGPGCYKNPYSTNYILHSGSMRFEANAEYRFPIFSDLYGALFVDAGNIWNLYKKNVNETQAAELEQTGFCIDEPFKFKNFFKELALGTGFGLRYDMDFLVLRLDVGVAIHAPYETSRSGYYNIPHWWKDGVQFHFAVGYPF